jgi:hypothetical protein
MATPTRRAPIRSVTIVAANAAAHPQGPNGSAGSTIQWNRMTATQTPSEKCATLNTSFSGDCRRCSVRAAVAPTSWPRTSAAGPAKNRPSTVGISPREKEWASRRNWRWMTKISATAKSPARIHHGIRSGASSGARWRTTVKNRMAAAPATATLSSQTRWAPFSRVVRTVGAPVVTLIVLPRGSGSWPGFDRVLPSRRLSCSVERGCALSPNGRFRYRLMGGWPAWPFQAILR